METLNTIEQIESYGYDYNNPWDQYDIIANAGMVISYVYERARVGADKNVLRHLCRASDLLLEAELRHSSGREWRDWVKAATIQLRGVPANHPDLEPFFDYWKD